MPCHMCIQLLTRRVLVRRKTSSCYLEHWWHQSSCCRSTYMQNTPQSCRRLQHMSWYHACSNHITVCHAATVVHSCPTQAQQTSVEWNHPTCLWTHSRPAPLSYAYTLAVTDTSDGAVCCIWHRVSCRVDRRHSEHILHAPVQPSERVCIVHCLNLRNPLACFQLVSID